MLNLSIIPKNPMMPKQPLIDDFTKSLENVVETVKNQEPLMVVVEEWKPNIKTSSTKISKVLADRLIVKLFQYDLDILMEMKFNLMWDLKMTQEEVDNLSFNEFYRLYKTLEEDKDKLKKTIK